MFRRLCASVCLCNGTTRQCACLMPWLLSSLWLSACMHACNNCSDINLQALGEPLLALIHSIALYTSPARSSMRAHRWPGFDTPKSNKKTKIIDLSHSVTEIPALIVYKPIIKGCKTFNGSQLLNACRYLGRTTHIFARLVEIFHLSPWSSLYRQPLQNPLLSPRGIKNFRVMQRRSVGRCISNLVELRWKMTVLAIFRLLTQTWPWHDLDLDFDLQSS